MEQLPLRETIFSNINKVSPGSYLEIDLNRLVSVDYVSRKDIGTLAEKVDQQAF